LDYYTDLEMSAFQSLCCVKLSTERDNDKDGGQTKQAAEKEKDAQLFAKNVDKAKQIWGINTVKELMKKTQEELEAEQYQNQVSMNESYIKEDKEWWGTATKDDPHLAYEMLIDAARYGTMLAYKQEGRWIGSIADAIEGSQYQSNLEEEGDFGGDDSANDAKSDSAAAIRYEPTELGAHAREHFEKFLRVMKGQSSSKSNIDFSTEITTLTTSGEEEEKQQEQQQQEQQAMMPDWWIEEEHEKALWSLAEDMEGNHCLAFALDKDELSELYSKNTGAQNKIVLIAGVAATIDNEYHDNNGIDYDDNVEEAHWKEKPSTVLTQAEYMKLTVVQLKDKLRDRGLKVSGRKAELVERLLQSAT